MRKSAGMNGVGQLDPAVSHGQLDAAFSERTQLLSARFSFSASVKGFSQEIRYYVLAFGSRAKYHWKESRVRWKLSSLGCRGLLYKDKDKNDKR